MAVNARAETITNRRPARRPIPAALLALALLAGPGLAEAPSGDTGGAPPPAAGAIAADKRAALAERRSRRGNLIGHGGPVKTIRVSPDGARAITGSFDYALMSWDIAGAEPRRLLRLDGHDGAVNAVAFVAGGKAYISAGDDGSVSIWDAATGRLLHRFKGHGGKVLGLAVSPDGRMAVTASWDRTARVWDLAGLAEGPVLIGHDGPVNAAAFSADGASIYTAGYDGTIRQWSVSDGSLVRPLHKHAWGINVLERLPGSERLVFGALDGTVAVVDPAATAAPMALPGHQRPVLAIASIEKPGLLATGGGDGLVRVLRIGDFAVLEEHRNPFGPVWALAFVPGGAALYYGGLDDFATYWRIAPREPFEAIDSAFPRRFQIKGAAGDAIAQGELQFARKCSICHTLVPDGANRAGPTLYGIFGRRIATLPGYPYSEPLRRLSIVWSETTISDLFEHGPEVVTPGSKMPLQRITNRAQREALIAFLKHATAPKGAMPAIDADGASGQGLAGKGDDK